MIFYELFIINRVRVSRSRRHLHTQNFSRLHTTPEPEPALAIIEKPNVGVGWGGEVKKVSVLQKTFFCPSVVDKRGRGWGSAWTLLAPPLNLPLQVQLYNCRNMYDDYFGIITALFYDL